MSLDDRPRPIPPPTVDGAELVGGRRRGFGGRARLAALVVAAVAVGVVVVASRLQMDADAGCQMRVSARAEAAVSRDTGTATDLLEPEPTLAFDGFRAVHVGGDRSLSVRHVWPLYDPELGDRFLALAERDLGAGSDVESIFLTSETGDQWNLVNGPVPGWVFQAGMLEGKVLRAIGWVPTSTGVHWAQYALTSELIWYEWGPTAVMGGLDGIDEILHITRNEAGWLAVVVTERGKGVELRFWGDGTTWAPVPEFRLPRRTSVVAVVPNQPRFVVVTSQPIDDERRMISAWSSDDRLQWTEHPIATLAGRATGLTGPDSACLSQSEPFALVGMEIVDGVNVPRAWTSPDGMSWSEAEIPSPMGRQTSGLVAVASGPMGVPEPDGYTRNYITAAHADAWTSADAIHWSPLPFLPADATDEIRSIAVLNGLVVAGGTSPNGLTFWVGKVFPVRAP
jgi:hypothetical protein